MSVPRASNPNLHAQSGAFTVEHVAGIRCDCPAVRRPLDEIPFLAWDKSPLPSTDPLFLQFTLPNSEAPALCWHLAREGYSAARCFPGFDGVARYLKEMARGPIRLAWSSVQGPQEIDRP